MEYVFLANSQSVTACTLNIETPQLEFVLSSLNNLLEALAHWLNTVVTKLKQSGDSVFGVNTEHIKLFMNMC